jgi:hypothetical protein
MIITSVAALHIGIYVNLFCWILCSSCVLLVKDTNRGSSQICIRAGFVLALISNEDQDYNLAVAVTGGALSFNEAKLTDVKAISVFSNVFKRDVQAVYIPVYGEGGKFRLIVRIVNLT